VVSRIAGFLDSGLVDVRSHTREDFEMAARVRAAHRTSIPDALHVATAVNAGCTVLVTNDARMPSVPGLEVVRLQELEQLDG
jgi:predicted nucleic acid-binding protein